MIEPAAPASPLIITLNFSPTGIAASIAPVMALKPSTPVPVRIAAARMASCPKMFLKMSSCASRPRSPIAPFSVRMISTSGFMEPSALRKLDTERPIEASAPTASSAGAMRRRSIVFSEVPASEPFTPALARIARAADVSPMD